VSAGEVLAIDGPAGAGKSTVARACAEALAFPMLDTGAMYRAVTFACLERGIDLGDPDACEEIAATVRIDVDDARTTLDGADVSVAIRTPRVTGAVSQVSAHPGVRAVMVAHQRAWADRRPGCVVEGRDIGTVVFPDARCKIFLSASPAERARRRQIDEARAGRSVDLAALQADIERRDRLDSERRHSPLTAAPDAVALDTTGRTIADVVDEIVARYRSAAASAR
jgi:cytidylate kinase